MVDARSTADGALVRVRLFGGVSIVHGFHESEVPGAGRRALLGLLACRSGEPVPVDVIVDSLWPDAPPRSAVKVVQTYVSQLRRLLGEVGDPASLRTTGAGYVLAIDGARIDVRRFEDAVAVAAGPREIASALARWNGAPYAGIALPFAEEEAARLARLRDDTEARLLEAMVAEGGAAGAVAPLERIAAARPEDERIGAALMEALAQVGRRGDALRAHERLRIALAEELGVDPDPELERRYLALLRGEARDASTDATARRASPRAAPAPIPLPPERTTLLGREGEVMAVRELLRAERLVTIVGAGGAGKTRLALRVAHECSVGRVVRWVPLAGLADERRVPDHALLAVGIQEQVARDALPVLLERLGSTEDLVVLDNCEHVSDAAAALVDALLRECPRVGVLVTSRTPLRVQGEQRWRIPPLSLPRDDTRAQVLASAAARLFIERARRADPGFAVDDAAAAHVARISRRLDGIPLAIELAAARVAGLGLRDLEAGLDESLALLTAGDSEIPRHRTLRAAIEWSVGLLAPAQAALLRRLAMFAGPFTLDAASVVAAWSDDEALAIPATLADLVESCVVERERDGRFRLLETVRQFGLDELGDERDEVRRRHGRWVADALEEIGRNLLHETSRWYRRLDDLVLDAQAAFARSQAAGDLETAARIASGAGWSLINAGRFALQREWGERVIASGQVEALDPAVAGPMLCIAGATATIDGRHEQALERLGGASNQFARGGDAEGALWVDYWRAAALADLWRFDESQDVTRTALARVRGAVDIEASLHAGLAEVCGAAHLEGSGSGSRMLERATESVARARDLSTRQGLEEILARVDMTEALLSAHRGALDESLERCGAELGRWRRIGRGNRLIVALIATSRVAIGAGRPAVARPLLREACELLDDAGWALPLGDAAEAAAVLAPSPQDAAALLGAAATASRTHRWRVGCDVAPTRGEVRARLGADRAERLEREGAAMPFGRVIATALAAVA